MVYICFQSLCATVFLVPMNMTFTITAVASIIYIINHLRAEVLYLRVARDLYTMSM